MAKNFHSMCEWYKAKIPVFGNGQYDFDRIKSILDSEAQSVPSEQWFPMPMCGFIIANTYHRPVIYYNPADAMSKLVLPCFEPIDKDVEPIIMAFIDGNHFISLELVWHLSPPLPFVHPKWPDLHIPIASDWLLLYQKEIETFMKMKWQRDWIASQQPITGNASPAIEVDSPGK